MAEFSSKERLLASLLSRFPGLKKQLKIVYIGINAIIYRKSYKYRLLSDKLKIGQVITLKGQETFFGYYDKVPMNRDGWVALHATYLSTRYLPDPKMPLNIVLVSPVANEYKIIGKSFSYNWQQGARIQWLNDSLLMYNDFRQGKYGAVVYSMAEDCEIGMFDLPVQDAYGTNYFLSINYRRIMRLRPDYGYRNLPLISDDDMKNLEKDGIWKVDYRSGDIILVHSLKEIIDCNNKPCFANCFHKVNHIMINKTGTDFIFIHRYYQGHRRYDRLMYSDFKSLKVLVDYGMVSHCCWLNNDEVLGYFRVEDKDGYYICNVKTNLLTACDEMNRLGVGDGHPSCYKNWVVFDTYPDKSRMQKLFLYNTDCDKVIPLLELYQSPCYMNQTRCDLHPRFSSDGKFIFFDTVYSGKRQLCYLDVFSVLN